MSFALSEDQRNVSWIHECHCETGRWWLDETGQDRPALLPLQHTDSYRGGTAHWDLVQVDPLTITASILCQECGLHGFITNGQWVSA